MPPFQVTISSYFVNITCSFMQTVFIHKNSFSDIFEIS